jgi:hypothetical protein
MPVGLKQSTWSTGRASLSPHQADFSPQWKGVTLAHWKVENLTEVLQMGWPTNSCWLGCQLNSLGSSLLGCWWNSSRSWTQVVLKHSGKLSCGQLMKLVENLPRKMLLKQGGELSGAAKTQWGVSTSEWSHATGHQVLQKQARNNKTH